MKRCVYGVIFVGLVLLALAFRTLQLDRRPVHHDESNQMVRAGILLEKGIYRYNPVEHHGPTLYYLSLPFAWLTAGTDFGGTSIFTYRLLPAFFGIGIVLLLLLVRAGLGWGATLVSALLTAVSTAMVYYSRFFIQETLLVFFTFGAIACGWQYFRSESAGWAVATGLFLGLMHATKETCVIAYGAMAVALVLTVMWNTGLRFKPVNFIVLPVHAVYTLFSALIISGLLFSSFFTNISGVWDSFAAYITYLDRGAGLNTDHTHPFYYYLQVLLCYRDGGLQWSEGIILFLGIVGIVMVVMNSRSTGGMDSGLCRFLVFYTLLMTLGYSMIKYKTPWCVLSFLHGWILLAGIGVVGMFKLLKNLPLRLIWVLAIALGIFSLADQTCRAAFRYSADSRNPYAYSHTVSDYMNLVRRIRDITALHEEGNNMPIAAITNPHDAWPLPWYLRDYDNVGYWNDAACLPDGFEAAIYVVGVDKDDTVKGLIGDGYQKEYWGLRPEVPLALYIRKDLWSEFMATR